MLKVFQTDLILLGHLGRAGERDLVRDCLLEVGAPFHLAGDSPSELDRAVRRLRSFLQDFPDLVRLLDLHLATRYLLARNNILPDWFTPWFEDNVDPELLFPGLGWRQAALGRWAAVPVFLVGDEVFVRYFIAGWMPGRRDLPLCPSWGMVLLEDSAGQAVRRAADAATALLKPAEEGSFCCYPLTVANNRVQFNGASLGLGLALGFLQAGSAGHISPRVACSGGLDSDGQILPVAHLQKKVDCAVNLGFTVFLFPEQQFPEVKTEQVELLPVTDVDEAWMFAMLYAPGKSKELLTLARILKDPRTLANNLDLVEPMWIEWAHRNGKLDRCLTGMLKSRELLETYVLKVQGAVNAWNLDAAEIYSLLLPVDRLKTAISGSPLAAFRFCAVRLALCNHRGDIEGADEWADMAKPLLSYARKADAAICADFLNNRFISLHNRYVFEPGLPRDLRVTLSCLEARYRAQCEGGCIADRALAELYGSIAQNFGFCGPRYLKQCEENAELAFQAFGNVQVIEYADDLLRQYACLIYAYLDAGEFDRARCALFNYLGAHSWEDVWDHLRAATLSRWQHAALARYLAEAGTLEQKQAYWNWIAGLQEPRVESEHPWQLWTNNLGRIACELEDYDAAVEFFKKSLDLCFAKEHGPTVRMMALMPLSGLRRIGRLPDGADSQLGTIREAARKLNPDYFASVLEASTDEMLEGVWNHPGTFFPFSYR